MAGKNKASDHTGLRLITSPFRFVWHSLLITLVLLVCGPPLLILLVKMLNSPYSLLDALQTIKQNEAAYVGDGLVEYINYAINSFVYWLFFKITLINHVLFDPLPSSSASMIAYRDKFVLPNKESILIFMESCQIMATRLALMTKTVPILFGIYFVALSLGLVSRSIRRTEAGRESSSLYHRYKYSQIWLFTISIQLYLVMPISVPVIAYFCVCFAICGVFFEQQMMFYKKYL